MTDKSLILETYSYNFYSRGAEPLLDSIRLERGKCGMRVPEYRSDYVQLIYFTKGTGRIKVNGSVRSVYPGMLAKFFPYHTIGIEAEPGQELEYFTCSFALSVLMYLDVNKRFARMDFSVVDSGIYLVKLSPKDEKRTVGALMELEQEIFEKQPHFLTSVLGNLLRVISLFDRMAELQYLENGPIERSQAWKALQYIHMHFNKDGLDAAMVADGLGITPLYLGHILRRLTGQNFMENLHEVRVRNACAMMHFEELSITYIARYVGYGSITTFHRIFKKIKGVTPEQYRNGVAGDVPISAHRDTAWKVLLYMMENYAKNIRQTTVAEEFYISEDTLLHICHENFGQSFSELLEQIRLGYACSLLCLPQLKIVDIVITAGFNSGRTFSRAFQKYFGTSPQKFRELQLSEKSSLR